MKRMLRAVYWIMTALIFGCGGSVRQEEPREGNAVTGEASKIATDPAPSTQPEAPPFVFTPQTRAPKHRHQNIRQPDVGSMPRLTMRFAQCFPEQSKKDRKSVV